MILDQHHPAIQWLDVKANETALFVTISFGDKPPTGMLFTKGLDVFLYVRQPSSKVLQEDKRHRFVMVQDPSGEIHLVHYASGNCISKIEHADIDFAQRCVDGLVAEYGLQELLFEMGDQPVING